MKVINSILLVIAALTIVSCSKNNPIDDPAEDKPIVTDPEPEPEPTPGSDVVGKVIVGYQGWFACAGDGQPGGTNWWWHWSNDWGKLPSNATKCLYAWPDVSDYTKTYQSGYDNLNNGLPAALYSCVDQQSVNVHFRWMKEFGIDGAALQRFNPMGAEGPLRDWITERVKIAAETYGVKFYIMYDGSNWKNMQTQMKTDWINKMQVYTNSPAYARQGDKPVVAIWGFGYNDANHPWGAAECLDVVNWFRNQGCYVIGGVPREWRLGRGGSRPGFEEVYRAFNMISPWLVGALSNISGANDIYTQYMVGDQAECNQYGMAYQPCVLPGGMTQRVHGDLMWRMFYNAVRVGCQGIYISMYDEYNEGNQIAKTSPTQDWVPANTTYRSLDYDGTYCTSDYYLRLTGDGARMLKGEIALTETRPTYPGLDYLEACDDKAGWMSDNTLSVYTDDRKQGTGCLQSVGSGAEEFKKAFSSPLLIPGSSAATGRIQFWYYVSDVTKLNSESRIEIGSSGQADKDVYSWSMGTKLVNGWNLVSKSFSRANKTGNPNLGKINWIRISNSKNGSLTTRMDGVRLIPR
ncbi:MAG: hypothetical protein LBH19_09405 [Dysgonamonadaceae bacterium]|jgi:hypothetical protein|nr:hypothetical protein [Dysgonamonadaceae bacterium]